MTEMRVFIFSKQPLGCYFLVQYNNSRVQADLM